MTAEERVTFTPPDDPRAAGPGTLIIPGSFAGITPRLAKISGSVTEAAEAIRTLAVLMAEAFEPACPCPGVTHTMRCGIGGRPVIILKEDEVDGEELDPTECVDGSGEPYPEHDFPETGTECRRCGAECDDIE